MNSRRSKGFTLLEVLIAVAIMAGIMTVLYAAFSSTASSVENAEATRDGTDLVRTLMTKLTSDIANAYVNKDMSESRVALTVFYGKSFKPDTSDDKVRNDELYLTTLTNWRRPGTKETDLWEVGYYFKQKTDGKGSVLMRREKRELSPDFPPLEGGTEYALTDRVKSLQLRYHNGSAWVDDWQNKSALPKAVEISLLMDDGSAFINDVNVENAK
jgi:general secretion pathway protein J